MRKLIPRTFFWRLLLAFMLVILISAAALILTLETNLPRLFDMHFGMMDMTGMGGMPMMGPQGGGRGGGSALSDLYAAFRAAVEGALVPATGVALAAAVILSAWMGRRFSQPVQRLTDSSRRIAAGHYNERLPLEEMADAPEEILEMAFSFNRMAEQIARTETLRRALIADVAHELRTPLTTIRGSMEGLLDGVLTPTPETFTLVHQEAARLERLVNDLQQLSRLESGRQSLTVAALGVGELVRGTVESIRAAYSEKGVALDVDIPTGLPPLPADGDRATQALLNLLTNALAFTPAGGRVQVSASRVDAAIQLEVQDTGIGIPPEHLPHVFERFYRAEKSRARGQGGSGIGLAITRQIMEAHGGEARAESGGEGQGSRFTLVFPLSE
ncbi:MAG: HAMP domain-containing protein [Chloroflexi bacterium]|nr:HAMP domain-containing protein [Chloroflexota bacterium]